MEKSEEAEADEELWYAKLRDAQRAVTVARAKEDAVLAGMEEGKTYEADRAIVCVPISALMKEHIKHIVGTPAPQDTLYATELMEYLTHWECIGATLALHIDTALVLHKCCISAAPHWHCLGPEFDLY